MYEKVWKGICRNYDGYIKIVMEGFSFLFFSLFQSLARNMKLLLKLKAHIYSFLKILVSYNLDQ